MSMYASGNATPTSSPHLPTLKKTEKTETYI